MVVLHLLPNLQTIHEYFISPRFDLLQPLVRLLLIRNLDCLLCFFEGGQIRIDFDVFLDLLGFVCCCLCAFPLERYSYLIEARLNPSLDYFKMAHLARIDNRTLPKADEMHLDTLILKLANILLMGNFDFN